MEDTRKIQEDNCASVVAATASFWGGSGTSGSPAAAGRASGEGVRAEGVSLEEAEVHCWKIKVKTIYILRSEIKFYKTYKRLEIEDLKCQKR